MTNCHNPTQHQNNLLHENLKTIPSTNEAYLSCATTHYLNRDRLNQRIIEGTSMKPRKGKRYKVWSVIFVKKRNLAAYKFNAELGQIVYKTRNF